MLRSGILNPHVLSLISRVRHTNTLVLADRGFPSWPGVETIDLSLTDDIPRIADVLRALLPIWVCGQIYMAQEFRSNNSQQAVDELLAMATTIPILWQPHVELKQRVPQAIGLIRTADTLPYSNMILESA
jgi:D-ribose pyranase